MKKSLVIAIIMAAAVQSWAQYDTLRCGMREPTFYYWDTNWFDNYVKYTQGNPNYIWYTGGMTMNTCQPEWARYCHTDTALRIIGVAAAMQLVPCDVDVNPDEDPRDFLEEEYFRLYELDSTTGEMVLLAEAEWTNNAPRYVMDCGRPNTPYTANDYLEKVFEAYFDTSLVVNDSFYVAVTEYNNRCGRRDSGHPYMRVHLPFILLGCYDNNNPDKYDFGPIPNHMRRKLHVWDGVCNTDLYNLASDTLWHVLHRTNNPQMSVQQEFNLFMPIFPIIDTSCDGSVVNPYECAAPTGLDALYVNSEVAVFSWNGGYAHQWQLSVAPDGGTPEGGIVYTCTTDMQSVTGLDTSRWYNAWVRTLCDNDSVSDWSDSIRFYVPGTNGGIIVVEQPIDALTHVMPNPASGHVGVISAYRMSRIDIYSANGSKVLSLAPSANTTTADISSLPAGSYLMRIYTTNGIANKRLVVK